MMTALMTGRNAMEIMWNGEYVTGRVQKVTGRVQRVTERVQMVTGRVQKVTERVQMVTGRVQRVTGRVQKVMNIAAIKWTLLTAVFIGQDKTQGGGKR
jgi:methyl-accepting chemotaxis protein